METHDDQRRACGPDEVRGDELPDVLEHLAVQFPHHVYGSAVDPRVDATEATHGRPRRPPGRLQKHVEVEHIEYVVPVDAEAATVERLIANPVGYSRPNGKPPATAAIEGNPVNATVLWIIAAVIAVVGLVQLIQGQIILGIVLLVVACLVGPGGYSVFRTRH